MSQQLKTHTNRRKGKISTIEKLQRQVFNEFIEKNVNVNVNVNGLSIGCGDGIWDYLAMEKGIKKITAVDIVENPIPPSEIEKLQKLGSWNFLKISKDKALPFPSNLFDISFSQDVIEHTIKPNLFLSEQFRVLKPGGVIAVGTPNIFRPANIMRIFFGKLKFPVTIGRNQQIGEYIHVQEFHENQLRLGLEEQGFCNVQIVQIYFGLSFSNINFVDLPTSNFGKTFSHFLFATGKKPIAT
jgi:2-polyprenyl-3-methyl-5-hydroxy-6-metoxy-1,4-benzoquinol methylase